MQGLHGDIETYAAILVLQRQNRLILGIFVSRRLPLSSDCREDDLDAIRPEVKQAAEAGAAKLIRLVEERKQDRSPALVVP
jgi:hypothetical protein